MEYLNQDHPSIQSEPLRGFAVDALLGQALSSSQYFRLQFDAHRLQRVIGATLFSELMPDFKTDAAVGRANYDLYHGSLPDRQRRILRPILQLTTDDFVERPLNSIRSVRLLAQDGHTILRGGDHNTFILFDLPLAKRDTLLDLYRQHGIPAEVIEQVEVDIEKLEP